MIKKTIFYISIAFSGILLIGVIITLALRIYVTKNRVIQLIEQNSNARVEIKDISVPLWASLSGITIQNLKVGHKDQQVKKKVNKREPMKQPLISVEEFNFKVSILKLITSLGKNFELKTLLLTKPKARVILYSKGGTNLDALLPSFPKVAKKGEKTQKRKRDVQKSKKGASGKPFSIKSIDTVIRVGRVGIEQGNFLVDIQKFKSTLKLEEVNAYVENIHIDPKNLVKKNKVDFNFSLSASLNENSENKDSVQSFLIHFKTNGRIQPFQPKTGYITERARLKIGLLSGTKFTGLTIFKRIKDKAEYLKKVGVNLDFLKNEVRLNKNAIADIFYRSGVVTFKSSLRIDTNDFLVRLKENSKVNIKKMNHDFQSDLIFNEKFTKKIKNEVEVFLAVMVNGVTRKSPAIFKNVSSSLKPSTLSANLLAPAIDKETNRFRLSIHSKGILSNPDITIIKPRLGDPQKEIENILGKQFKDVKNMAKQAVNKATQEAKKKSEQKSQEALNKANALAEKKRRKIEEEIKRKAKKAAKKFKLHF